MPNLTPASSFDNVPELETTTLALGGPGGPMNLPAQALLNRTQWLKDNASAGSAGPYAEGAGTANACTATFSPPISATADGLKLRFSAAAANTGPATFAPDAVAAAPILGQAGLALQGGEIASNGEVEVTWSDVLGSWVMTSCSGGNVQVANATASHHAVSKGQLDAVSVVANGAAKSADLSSSTTGKGSKLIAFIQRITGAVARWVEDKLAEHVSVNDFGAAGDGTTDDTAAIQAAANSGAARILFPSRGYMVSSAITIPANTELVGAGPFATYIRASTTGQTVFQHINAALDDANIAIRNMEIAAGSTTGVLGVAFTLCLYTQLENVVFTGLLRNFDYDRGNTHSITNCVSRGSVSNRAGSFRLWSSDDADYIYMVNIDGYLIRNVGNGVNGSPAACYIRRGVSVMLGGINCNDANAGGSVAFVLFENDCQGCKLFNGIVGASDVGVNFQIGTGVSVAPSFITVDNFDFDHSATQAALVGAGNRLTITNCNVTSSGVGSGINAFSINNGQFITVANNHFNGYNTASGSAVTIFGTASNVEVIGNTIESCVNGVWIVSSGAVGMRVLDNTFSSVTTPLTGALSTLGANCLLRGNSGTLPGAITPSMPASTVAVANTQGMAMRVYIAGTVSAIKVNGLTVGLVLPGMLILNPGETIALTYSSAPTWQWQAMQ